MARRRMEEQAKLSGLGDSLTRNTFDTYIAKEAWQEAIKQKAIQFAQESKFDWFFVGGQIGSGKTHICTAIVGEMIQRGYQARYMLWRDEIARIKRHMNEEQYEIILDRFREIPLLYIDDFFKADSAPTSADINIAFEILDYRYRMKLPTIISSEMKASELMSFDEAIGSRIFERAKGFMLSIGNDKTKNMRIR